MKTLITIKILPNLYLSTGCFKLFNIKITDAPYKFAGLKLIKHLGLKKEPFQLVNLAQLPNFFQMLLS